MTGSGEAFALTKPCSNKPSASFSDFVPVYQTSVGAFGVGSVLKVTGVVVPAASNNGTLTKVNPVRLFQFSCWTTPATSTGAREAPPKVPPPTRLMPRYGFRLEGWPGVTVKVAAPLVESRPATLTTTS